MNNEVAGIVAIDDGGSSTICVTKNGIEVFPSVKGFYGNRTLTQVTSKYDFIIDYKGDRYCGGDLAVHDCDYKMQLFSKSKQHDFFDLSVLIAIHQYGYSTNKIIVSVPVKMHTEDEKNGRITRLKGSHTITVNGEQKTFAITDLKIVPESASAFWCNQPKGKSNFIDIGSRTIGYSSVINNQDGVRFLNTESGVFKKGIELLGDNYNSKALAEFLHGNLSRIWNKNDKVYLLGGGALDANLVTCIKEHFPNSEVMEEADMANVNGMYSIGRILYGMD